MDRMHSGWSLRNHLHLQARLLRFLLRRAPGTTLANTLARTVSQFALLLALFLPIKVILLMGSEHVPDYFSSYIRTETRDAWIIGLAGLAGLLYVMAVGLMALSRRLSAHAADHLTGMHAQGGAEHNPFQRAYALACRVYANLLIVVVGLLALAAVDPRLLATVAGLLVVEFLLARSLLKGGARAGARLGALLKRNPEVSLRALGNLNFLLVFATLLVDYLVSGKASTLSAILGLLLARRIFQSAAALAQRSIALERSRTHIEPILTPGTQSPDSP